MLHTIHRYGYIHGSLTLSNILVLRGPGRTNEPAFTPFLLSDIGLAYFVRRSGHPQITRLPITAAPEQWRGRYTSASDQYALAILVYLWLAGRPPFIGSPEEIEQAKHKATFPLLSSSSPTTRSVSCSCRLFFFTQYIYSSKRNKKKLSRNFQIKTNKNLK